MSKAQKQSTVPANAGAKTPAKDVYDFKKAAEAHSHDDFMAYAEKIKTAFETRIRHEVTNSSAGANAPIVDKLNKRQEAMSSPDVIRAMMELGADPNFINSTLSKKADGSRFNIYGIDKAIKLAKFMMSTDKIPGVLTACLKSMINFDKAGKVFTREFAEAAVSDKIRLPASDEAKLLARHTVDKNTASTQTSSNMRVLEALGIIKVQGTARSATYAFNDSDQSKHLQQLIAA